MQSLEKNTKEQYKLIKAKIIKSTYCSDYYAFTNIDSIKNKSRSEDDWHFCLLILKFIESHIECTRLLEEFLRTERYREKFDLSLTYLETTIEKVIKASSENGQRGTLANGTGVLNPDSAIVTSTKLVIPAHEIIRTCNIAKCFFLNSEYAIANSTVNVSNQEDNKLEVSFNAGPLNGYDLTIFVYLLSYFSKYPTIDGIDLDMPHLLKICRISKNGESYSRIQESLSKLSKTHLSYNKKITQETSRTLKDAFYTSSGTILSYLVNYRASKIGHTDVFIYINIFLNILQIGNYNYACINVADFMNLRKHDLRILYYFFCLNIRPTQYFTKFTIKELALQLYFQSSNIKQKNRNMKVRKLLLEFHKYIPKDFHMKIYKNKRGTIEYIEIKRVKAFVTKLLN
nr:PUT_PRODUCT [Ahnfeltia plicata]